MSVNTFLTICPADCDTELLLPAVETNQDCTKVAVTGSQIEDIVILPNGATGAVDWTVPANWTSVIDNTDVLNAKAKHLVGEGGKGASEPVTIPMPKGKTKVKHRLHTVTFTMKNVSDLHYAFGQAIQCGYSDFTFWYSNEANTFGGQTGIIPASATCDFPLGEGVDDIELMVLTFTFKSDGDPPRTATIH